MFKADLLSKFQRVFGVNKTTFDAPDYAAPEQDSLFIEISDVKPRMSGKDGGRATCVVAGAAIIFSQSNRLPFGFFAKRVEQADIADTKNFIFEREVDVANSPARVMNLHERRMGFTFLFDTQYDPDRGELTSVTFTEVTFTPEE
jgi:hypothetical protein